MLGPEQGGFASGTSFTYLFLFTRLRPCAGAGDTLTLPTVLAIVQAVQAREGAH
jgi:hypothetical protein